MYAIVLTGGKQYRVTAGSIIEVEKLEANAGDTIKLEQVLAVSGDKNVIGAPFVTGAVIEAQVIAQGKAEKVLIFKKKRRHNYRRKNGHRQRFTALHILSVSLGGQVAKVEPRTIKEKTAPVATKPSAVKAAAKKVAAPKAETVKKPAAAKKPAAVKKPAAKKAAK